VKVYRILSMFFGIYHTNLLLISIVATTRQLGSQLLDFHINQFRSYSIKVPSRSALEFSIFGMRS